MFATAKDFELLNANESAIPIGVQHTCFEFHANDDVLIEGNEVVTVAVDTTNLNDISSNTSVVILDNDGKP